MRGRFGCVAVVINCSGRDCRSRLRLLRNDNIDVFYRATSKRKMQAKQLRKSSKVRHLIRRFPFNSVRTYRILVSQSNMAQSQVELESLTTDLTAGAFNAFCQDVSEMFDTAVSVEQLDIAAGTTKQLKNTYKKLAAVCSVKAQGALNGQFQVVFGTEGLFTLAGTIAMQPEQIIKENRQGGTKTEANELADAVAEVSNLIVGGWDRVFCEEMPEHKHFVQSGTFIGNPSVKSEENIGLAADAELVILTFEMSIEPLPAFKCSVIYPKSLFEPSTDEAGSESESADEETPVKEAGADEVAAEPAGEDEAGTEPGAQEAAREAAPGPAEGSAEEASEAKAGSEGSAEETATAGAAAQAPSSEESGPDQAATEGSATEQAQSGPETTAEESEQPAQAQEDSTQQEPSSEQRPESQDEQQEASGQAQEGEFVGGSVTEAIAKMTHSAAVLPGQFADSAAIFTGLTAKDVMTANVVWASPDATVEQLFAKMQQHDTAYLLIGEKAHLQGIVSKSDVRGALSPYLQSMFSKWRTSMDIATLKIKAQWIMSRPVCSVRPEATLASVMQGMSEHGGRCMPVTDEEGKVHGLVTVFDIFGALLTCTSGVSTAG